MIRDPQDPQIVELSEGEQIVHEWYMSLLNMGWSHGEAVERILTSVHICGPTWSALNNQEFRDWLAGAKRG